MQKTAPTEILYTAQATAEDGGREGHVRSSDGTLDLQLSRPVAFRGKGGEGTNPEQLFAAGYSACFATRPCAQGPCRRGAAPRAPP